MKDKGWLALLKETFTEWNGHNATRLGASVAFYSILSFAPLLVLTVAVIAIVFGKSSAQATLVSEAQQMIGDRGAAVVVSLLKNSQRPSAGIFSSIVAFATLLFGASGVFTELRDAMDIMWDAKRPEASGIWGMVRDRLFSFGIVLSVGFLLLVSLLLSAALAFVGHAFGSVLPVPALLLEGVNFLLSIGVITALFTLMFKFLPATKPGWRNALVGGIGTALLFTIGKFLLGIYIGKASVGSTYGAAGSLVAVVVWIYYSAQIFFFGAEFTHVYAKRREPAASSSAPPSASSATPAPAAKVTVAAPQPAVQQMQPKAMAAAASVRSAFAVQVAPEPTASAAPPTAAPIGTSQPASIRASRPRVAPVSAYEPAQKPKLLLAMGLGFVLGRVFSSGHKRDGIHKEL